MSGASLMCICTSNQYVVVMVSQWAVKRLSKCYYALNCAFVRACVRTCVCV